MEKTNVMRILAQNKIEFNAYEYNPDETVGENVAAFFRSREQSTGTTKT